MTLNCWRIPTSEDEIVDVFIEEVGELLENIDNHMKLWINRPEDKKTLTEIRRNFHTLKGSGRMVKALDLSEMAWKVENMLNQAIVGIVPVSEAMMELVAAVRAKIPRLVDAFKDQRSIATNGDILRLMKLADTLATERKPTPVSAADAATAIRGKQEFNSFEFDLKLERCMQRADEALHRSEMALQQARRLSALSEAPKSMAGQQHGSAEVDQIAERVKLLAKEVSDVRREYENSQIEPILHQGEMDQLLEQRMQERLVPMEFLRVEIKRNIEENRQAVTALRRSWWLALTLGALVGGVVATGLLISLLALG